MNQQRGPLLLILWAAILVSGGYASPIHQSNIHDDFAFHGAYAIYGSTSTDNWLGGTGDWSDLTFWSGGLPGIASDVYINTGNDLAYLDTNATIASLTLGGTTGSSELSSTGTTNYLTIAGALTVNQTGTLSLDSGDTVAAATLSINSGTVNLNGGSALLIYGDASNSGSIYLGNTSGGNNLTINGVLTNHGNLGVFSYGSAATIGGLLNDGNIDGYESQLTVNGNANNSGSISFRGRALLQVNGGTLSNSGDIYLSTASLQVNGVVYNSGQVIQDFGSVVGVVGTLTNDVLGSIIFYGGSDQLSVQGDVNNAGLIGTGSCCFGSSDTINITGVLNNTGTLSLAGFGNTATIGSIVNSGAIGLDEYDPQHEVTRLQVNGDVYNSGQIGAGGASVVNIGGTLYNSGLISTGEGGGNVVNIGGTLYNTGYFSLGGPFDSSNIGTLVNGSGGGIDVENQSSLSVNGDANNSGGMFVGGDSALSINGTLNNSGSLAAYGNADGGSNSASVGSLVNSGTIDLENGSALQVYGDASNSGSISLGSLDGGNSLGVSGTLTNQGSLALNASDTVNAGSLVNNGTIDLENGSVLQVNGDANNSWSITLGNSSGGNSLIVNGTMTNQGSLTLYASSANVGSLAGDGMVDLENGSGLQVNGDASIGSLSMNASSMSVAGLVNGGMIDLENGSGLQVNGDANIYSLSMNASSMSVAGSLVNGGMIDLENGSGLQVNGDASGFFLLNGSGLTVNGTLDGGMALYGSSASVGGSANAGGIDLEGSGLQISGDANIGAVSMSSSDMSVGGSMDSSGISMDYSSLTVNGMLTNHGDFLLHSWSGASVGSLVNSGMIDLENMSVLQVNGDASNSGSIYLGNSSGSSSFIVNGVLTNQGYLSAIQNATVVVGSLVNDGAIDLLNDSRLSVKGNAMNSGSITSSYGTGGNTITVAGRLTNSPTGTFSLDGAYDVARIGSVVNQGAVYIADAATLQVIGPRAAASALSGFTNLGTVSIAHGGNLASPNSYVQTAGQTTVDGSLNVSGRGMVNFAGGVVYGNDGTISGPVISNASINIGDSLKTIGQLSFMGNYTQGPHGSLTFDIAGSELGQYDQLNITGHAQLHCCPVKLHSAGCK